MLLLTLLVITASAQQWFSKSSDQASVLSSGPDAAMPSRRNPSTWCVGSSSGDDVYVFGGKTDLSRTNDFWKWESSSSRWLWQPDPPSSLQARSGSSYWQSDNDFWLYGGRNDDSTNNGLDDLWSYNPSSRVWTFHDISPNPGKRFGSASWINHVTNTLYLYGGKSGSGVVLEDMWSFDISTSKWSQVTFTGSSPGPKDDGIAISKGGNVYMLAGSDFHRYEYISGGWTKLANAPYRDDFAMWDETGSVCVFGGRSSNKNEVYGDTWCYDIASNSWKSSTSEISNRWGSGHCQVGSRVYVVGGSGHDNLYNDVWSNVYSVVQTPTQPIPTDNSTVNSYVPAVVAAVMSSFTVLVALMGGICFVAKNKCQMTRV